VTIVTEKDKRKKREKKHVMKNWVVKVSQN